MSTGTGIEWTDTTWNPVVGCTPVSPGCLNCYAATMARRLEAMGREEYVGLTVKKGGVTRVVRNSAVAIVTAERHDPVRDVFNGTVRTVPDRLDAPLGWRKPRMVFVNSMSDLFHEAVPFEFIDRVFAVMALCPQHTFQVLTKRPERMAEYLNATRQQVLSDSPGSATTAWHVWAASSAFEDLNAGRVSRLGWSGRGGKSVTGWPLPNVWLGTSVENGATADLRIGPLLRCPAAVRFLSCEPLLEEVVVRWDRAYERNATTMTPRKGIHWVIVGGESGANARPCNVEWIRSIVQQCRAAQVPVFVKQLGTRPYFVDQDAKRCGGSVAIDVHALAFDGWKHTGRLCKNRKGADPAEWPEDLRVREWPSPGTPNPKPRARASR